MIRKKQKEQQIVIDLTGPQGNAYFLLGMARKLAKQLGIPHQPIENDMMCDDYENLVQVFDKNFGDFVILER
jgi:hypothetical protein